LKADTPLKKIGRLKSLVSERFIEKDNLQVERNNSTYCLSRMTSGNCNDRVPKEFSFESLNELEKKSPSSSKQPSIRMVQKDTKLPSFSTQRKGSITSGKSLENTKKKQLSAKKPKVFSSRKARSKLSSFKGKRGLSDAEESLLLTRGLLDSPSEYGLFSPLKKGSWQKSEERLSHSNSTFEDSLIRLCLSPEGLRPREGDLAKGKLLLIEKMPFFHL
jgi:hypothetical protein